MADQTSEGVCVAAYRGFESLPLRQFRQSQRFSGLIAALELAKHGDVLMAMLLTASSGK
jgi:hypothetical protein